MLYAVYCIWIRIRVFFSGTGTSGTKSSGPLDTDPYHYFIVWYYLGQTPDSVWPDIQPIFAGYPVFGLITTKYRISSKKNLREKIHIFQFTFNFTYIYILIQLFIFYIAKRPYFLCLFDERFLNFTDIISISVADPYPDPFGSVSFVSRIRISFIEAKNQPKLWKISTKIIRISYIFFFKTIKLCLLT